MLPRGGGGGGGGGGAADGAGGGEEGTAPLPPCFDGLELPGLLVLFARDLQEN